MNIIYDSVEIEVLLDSKERELLDSKDSNTFYVGCKTDKLQSCHYI